MALGRTVIGLVSGLMMAQFGFAFSVNTESVAPNQSFQITKDCDAQGACDYAFVKANAGSNEQRLLEDILDVDVQWPAPGLARIEYGGCGTSCFNTLFVNAQGQVDTVNNLIALSPKDQCVVYPEGAALVSRTLFSQTVLKQMPFSDPQILGLEEAAMMAMTDAQFDAKGDLAIEFVTVNNQQVKYILPKFCTPMK